MDGSSSNRIIGEQEITEEDSEAEWLGRFSQPDKAVSNPAGTSQAQGIPFGSHIVVRDKPVPFQPV